MIVLTCRRCRGSGEVPNLQFEICQKMTSPSARQHFCIPGEDCQDEGEWVRMGCVHGKTIPCPVCGGEGVLEFDEEEWDLSVQEGVEGGDEGTQPAGTPEKEDADIRPGAPAGSVTTPP